MTALAVVTALLSGCASSQAVPYNEAQAAPAFTRSQRPPDYLIQPGDELDIKFFFNPELNESVVVRPDGKISLPVIDEVQAAGLKPSELNALITQTYAQELRKPMVTVIVKTFTSQRVYVGGEVGKPGVIELRAGMTALHAVIEAGGFKDTARPGSTLVVRSGPEIDAPIPMRINLDRSIDGAATNGDIVLQPFDVVYVPKSAIANANLFVQQYIRGILLFQGWGFNPNPFFYGDR